MSRSNALIALHLGTRKATVPALLTAHFGAAWSGNCRHPQTREAYSVAGR